MSKPLGLLYTGNALEILKTLPDESVQMCVTSPPYWGLRDYKTEPVIWGGDVGCSHDWTVDERKPQSGGTGAASSKQLTNRGTTNSQESLLSGECLFCNAWKGSLGNEPTPELFTEHLVMIFREARRVLRNDGTLWVVIGDTYFGGGRGGNPEGSVHQKQKTNAGSITVKNNKLSISSGCKPKDLVGIPWMLAFALRSDGWWLRQDILWSKKNPMPSSVTDRCVTSHEYVFLLSKSSNYYFDHIVIREPAVAYAKGKRSVSIGSKSLSRGQSTGAGVAPSGNALVSDVALNPMRNKRSVWTLSSKPFKGSHFATFPETLVEPMILAGTSEYGACAACGTPYTRKIERCESIPDITQRSTDHYNTADRYGADNGGNAGLDNLAKRMRDGKNGIITVDWVAGCSCNSSTRPCTVLDCFSGAATTGKVALSLGREYIGIEANSDYNEIARKRLLDAGLDVEVI